MGGTPGSAQPSRWSNRGTPRAAAPPIEQRFTGPIAPAPSAHSGNPFGSLPGIASGKRKRSQVARALTLHPVNLALTVCLAFGAVLAYASHVSNGSSRVVVTLQHLLWEQ